MAVDVPLNLIWDVAVKTALVLALLYGVLWAIRRFYGKTGVVHRGPAIEVVQSAQLGPGRSVHLIGVGERMLLVGATSQQVSLLAEIGALKLEAVSEPQGTGDAFDHCLRQALEMAGSLPSRWRRRGQPEAGEGEVPTGAGK